jgi:hypothetical protein
MNRFLKPLLILLGLALIGYAICFPIAAIDSPMSAWENTLGNYVHHDDSDGLVAFFNKNIIARIRGGWKPVVFLGLAVTVIACFIKTGHKDGSRK